MSGYGDEALTKKKFCGGWWRSGDLGCLDEDGFLFVHGRTDNVINTGGIKVQGEEVEHCLIAHPRVTQVAVVGMPDEKWGQRVEAHLSVSGEVTEADLEGWCQQSGLAPFKRPKRYVFHSELPMGVTGKLDRPRLRALKGSG
ncbi:MAG: class I adenylate-forming enzyme family protein [Parahaliea sp.]